MISGVNLPPFPRERMMRWSLVIGIGWIICADPRMDLLDPTNSIRHICTAWLLWLGVCLGSMGIVMIHHLMGGDWGFMVRRLGEHAAMTLPLLIVLFIPIVIGMH